MKKNYGWKPQLPDFRDSEFSPTTAALPTAVDLRDHCPPVYDQGQLGSCTANGIAACIEFDQIKMALATFTPSRLFIYYNERALEGTILSDSGANIRDGIKSVNTQGVCPESEWPYDIKKFIHRPFPICYKDAGKVRSVIYSAIKQDAFDLRAALAAGFPVVFGFTVYESFESQAVADSGLVPMPAKHEGTLGGHCVVLVGYDDASQMFICRNSWGTGWGLAGYFKMPYAYVTNKKLASDFWQIRSIS